MPSKLPPKCLHCGAREPLDDEGFCLDYHACIARRPLGASQTRYWRGYHSPK